MSKFKLSNNIFALGLSSSELTVYAYLCSLPSDVPMLDGGAAIKVKQATIAQKCGIKAVQTVSKVISLLNEKGLVEPIRRSVKLNGHKGTYIYNVKKLPVDDSFFFVDRYVFGKLVPRQMMIYLFICKAFSFQFSDSWNSYNDIAAQTGMKRETVIETVAELVDLKLIVRSKRKSVHNRRVYVDNHYQLIVYVKGSFKGKRKVRLYRKYNRTEDLLKPFKVHYYNNTLIVKCQELMKTFFVCRGSPQN